MQKQSVSRSNVECDKMAESWYLLTASVMGNWRVLSVKCCSCCCWLINGDVTAWPLTSGLSLSSTSSYVNCYTALHASWLWLRAIKSLAVNGKHLTARFGGIVDDRISARVCLARECSQAQRSFVKVERHLVRSGLSSAIISGHLNVTSVVASEHTGWSRAISTVGWN